MSNSLSTPQQQPTGEVPIGSGESISGNPPANGSRRAITLAQARQMAQDVLLRAEERRRLAAIEEARFWDDLEPDA